ncbi:response regulator [Calothrix sp. FACHB-1219]|uniref:hybrid sensor histidine kinase/response regulator n=1 Tax=unclassified Calothrix TaxID=2619626 RepID=UPI0016874A49|nr:MULTISPECIES: ATP-binding protein [unclassified Calothrix]MBD2206714.1 response regulator [Calothrix sp. FACHB-168]MBD2219704.1 response regulator [Calothrix sp. FACHB-1219]
MAQVSSLPTILIVEDEWVIALDIKQHLQKLGYSVCGTANSAAKALELVATTKPDLVLMDIYLQGDKSGIEAADQIRQQFYIPVIFLTAHADEATLAQAIATHPYGYIVKPFEEQDLIIAIQVALANHLAEQANRQALKKEKQLNELKSQFVSIVSHEFRNPLSSLLLTLELLEQPDILTPEKRQAHIERGKITIKHMAQLITDVLVLGQVEQEQFHCQPTPLNIYHFCSYLVEDLQFRSPTTERLVFTVSGCDTTANLFYELDASLLQHILTNLLENALKYSPEASKVTFTLHCEPDCIEFQIHDQGIGLTEQDQAKLFTPFHRGVNVNKIPGTGLGLSITKKCVDAHGGQISVHSNVGVGTTFTVVIPAQKIFTSNSPSAP